jgi:iron complex outermembrane receptor protein
MKQIWSVFLLVGMLLTPLAWAQEMASVRGNVLDPNGDPLPGVQVTIGTQTRITDEDGFFSLEVLPGDYQMIAALEGFNRVDRGVTVAAAGLDIDVTMMVAVRETVTVTGSYIPGQLIEEGPAPISVFDLSQYEDRGSPDFEEVIRHMPEMYGHSNVANQYTASTFNIGMRAANIRGLGTQRNLVLLNGRRVGVAGWGPQGTMVDLASFPRIAMKRVEVLKEASPIYGSDAITGVVNYITDDRFVGLKAEVAYTDVEDSQGGDLYAGFMKGWEVGPLNLTLAVEYNERNRVRIFDKGWFQERTNGMDGSWPLGSSFWGQPGGFLGLGPTGAPAAAELDPACGTTNPDTGATSFPHPWRPFGLRGCAYYYTAFTNFIEPQQRINVFSQFTFEVSDRQELYGFLLYTNNDSTYTASPTYPPMNRAASPFNGGPSSYVPWHNPGLQDFVSTLPPEQQANWAGGAIFFGRPVAIAGLVDFGSLTQGWPRRQQTLSVQGGVRGEWGSGPRAVQYDFSLGAGSTAGQLGGHDVLIDRWAAANHGMGGPACDPENGTPGVPPCYYWNNFYSGWTSDDPALRNRQDVFDWMLGDGGSKYLWGGLTVYANFSGASGLELGGGPLSWAAGYEYQYYEGSIAPTGQNYSDNFLEESPFIFLPLDYPAGWPNPFSGGYHAAFGELLLPLADTFELGLAARYTKVTGLEDDPTKGRVAARWTPVPQLVLRASFSQGIIIAQGGESDQWGRYFGEVGGHFLVIEVPPVKLTGGLHSEQSDSVNLGFIWHPVPQVTIAADIFHLDFYGPILTENPEYVLANKPEQVEFDESGLPTRVITHTINGPDLEIRGLDFSFNWDIHTSAGLFSLGFDGALLDRYLFAAHEGLGTGEYDVLGRMNGTNGEAPILIYSTPELKYNARAGWQKGRHSLHLMYHHVDGYVTELLGADRVQTHFPPYNRVDAFNTFDLHYALRIPSWHTTFRISLLNAGDEPPPVVWDELAYDAMTHNPLGRRLKVGVSYQF